MYKPKHFKTQELVSERVYEERGEKALELLDSRILEVIDYLREQLGRSITVNSWLWDGPRSQSGLRDVGHYKTLDKYHSTYSQHKYGRAIDFLVKGMSAEDVRQYIYDHRDEGPLSYITFIEEDVSWVHVDCRNCERITRWSPTRGFLESK